MKHEMQSEVFQPAMNTSSVLEAGRILSLHIQYIQCMSCK